MKSLLVSFCLAVVLLLLFAVYGCGTRKTDRSTSGSGSTDININSSYSMGEKVVFGSSFTYTPSDPLKPMIIGGKSYQNAVVKAEKRKTTEKYLLIKEKTRVHTTYTIEKVKIVYRSGNTVLFLGLFFILALFLFIYFYLKTTFKIPKLLKHYSTKFKSFYSEIRLISVDTRKKNYFKN